MLREIDGCFEWIPSDISRSPPHGDTERAISPTRARRMGTVGWLVVGAGSPGEGPISRRGYYLLSALVAGGTIRCQCLIELARVDRLDQEPGDGTWQLRRDQPIALFDRG